MYRISRGHCCSFHTNIWNLYPGAGVSAHTGQNCELCSSAHGRLPGTLRYTVQPRLSGPRLFGPSIIRTRKYITMHTYKAWPMIFCRCGHRLSDELWTDLGQNWLTNLLFWTLLAMYRYRLYARFHKPGEKCRHFSYPDISLIWYGSDQPVDKGVWIIEVALY